MGFLCHFKSPQAQLVFSCNKSHWSLASWENSAATNIHSLRRRSTEAWKFSFVWIAIVKALFGSYQHIRMLLPQFNESKEMFYKKNLYEDVRSQRKICCQFKDFFLISNVAKKCSLASIFSWIKFSSSKALKMFYIYFLCTPLSEFIRCVDKKAKLFKSRRKVATLVGLNFDVDEVEWKN